MPLTFCLLAHAVLSPRRAAAIPDCDPLARSGTCYVLVAALLSGSLMCSSPDATKKRGAHPCRLNASPWQRTNAPFRSTWELLYSG